MITFRIQTKDKTEEFHVKESRVCRLEYNPKHKKIQLNRKTLELTETATEGYLSITVNGVINKTSAAAKNEKTLIKKLEALRANPEKGILEIIFPYKTAEKNDNTAILVFNLNGAYPFDIEKNTILSQYTVNGYASKEPF